MGLSGQMNEPIKDRRTVLLYTQGASIKGATTATLGWGQGEPSYQLAVTCLPAGLDALECWEYSAGEGFRMEWSQWQL